MSKRKFSLGQTVITQAAEATFERAFVVKCLARHVSGDWGDLAPEDAKMNDAGLGEHPDRLHSSYATPEGGKLWVITEIDRSVTTVLLPEDY
ncbi:hypothetical protein LCGC14_2962560 [marine sediment metagenome]|uniref:Plasmid related protein n=1 Tax=marine sediment metagenome TaxID=412755 RepID=A0A0F9A335_9ZZZZ